MINVIHAKYLEGFKLRLLFEISDYAADSRREEEKEVDLQEYLLTKQETGVFAPLKDVEYFKNFRLNANTLEWPNGADVAPERLYEQAV